MVRNFLRCVVLVMILPLSTPAEGLSAGQMVVGYYPEWSKSAYPCTSVPYQYLTHILHAFLLPHTDGTLGAPQGFLYPQLIQSAHQNGVKVLVSVGGWGQDAGLRALCADTAARHRFVSVITSFCVDNGYDGADIDYEYPGNATDRSNFTLLMHELRAAFNAQSSVLLLSIAAPGGWWSGQWFDLAAIQGDLDWIGIMTYDYYGSWSATSGPNSALYGSGQNTQGWVDNAVSYFAATRGVPKEKLLIGTPFYGWMFSAAAMYGPSSAASQLTYASIAPKLQQGWVRSWDATGQVPYLTNAGNSQIISYDDTTSVAAKCAYIKSKNIAGTIVWALGQDLYGGQQVLLETIGKSLRGGTADVEVSGAGTPAMYELEQNYPNPFNGQTAINYSVGARGHVSLVLYDLLGRAVRRLVNEELPPGAYQALLHAEDLASGVYYYRLSVNGYATAKSMILLR